MPLNPCPYCGGTPELIPCGDYKELLVYRCSSCHNTPVRSDEGRLTKLGAMSIWNFRSDKAKIFTEMFAVLDDNFVIGVYPTLADAEEAIFTECEDYIYEVICTDDPLDVLGEDDWNFSIDYYQLMKDASRCFNIQKVSVFK